MLEAVANAGYKAGGDVFLALDVASSEMWDNGRYVFKKSGEPARSIEEMVAMLAEWARDYPIISIEDGVAEGDWTGWKLLTKELGDKVQLVGDDVFVTNPEILKRGIDEGVGNALLVKVNQIGTMTETLEAMADGARGELRMHRLASLGRDRRRDDCRPRRRDQRGPDQNGIGQPHRSRREVQPAAPHRGSARQRRPLRRTQGHPAARGAFMKPSTVGQARSSSSCSTAGACAKSAKATPSSWRGRRPTSSCSIASRTRRSRRPGEAVGLPAGQMGNSEVGHITMGAGRVVYQDLTRIDKSIRDGDFFEKPALVDAMARCQDDAHALHLVGLVSPNGIHSHTRHLYALDRDGGALQADARVRAGVHRRTRYVARPAAPDSSASSSR